jgi:GNAT superfamily N-acetyltransferase
MESQVGPVGAGQPWKKRQPLGYPADLALRSDPPKRQRAAAVQRLAPIPVAARTIHVFDRRCSLSTMRLRPLAADDWDSLASLIHASLSVWYRANLNSEKFGADAAPFRVFPELYEALDPGCCLVAEDEGSMRLAGSVFYHPRETHWAVGIVNTHPDFGGRGVAKQLMQAVIGMAQADRKPVRLVSSAMNLDSFSLYTRLGFVPRMMYQDLLLGVPANGMPAIPAHGLTLRRAVVHDAPRIADLEWRLNGIRREKDFAHFAENVQGCWRLWLAERTDGSIAGFLGAVMHPGMQMIGPGVIEDETAAIALLHAMLDAEFRGRAIVWLVPVHCAALVCQCYAWGARNVEMHLGSVLGDVPPMSGVTFPTFMPETG